jgi:hypothetical protein
MTVLTVAIVFDAKGECVLPLIDESNPMYAKLDDLQMSLLREYRDNYVKLTDFYYNATVSASEKEYVFFNRVDGKLVFLPEGAEPIAFASCDWEYRSNGCEYYRIEKTTGPPEFTVPRRVILLVSPQKFYALEKPKPESRYYSIHLEGRKPGENDPSIDTCFQTLPFNDGCMQLKYLLFQKPHHAEKSSIESITKRKDPNLGEVVTVEMVDTAKTGGAVRSRFVFLRDYFWVLTEVVVSQRSSTYTVTNKYKNLVKGEIPLIESSTKVRVTPDGKNKYRTVEFKIKKIQPGPAPLSEFDVAQFLPPNTHIGIKTVVFTVTRIILIVAGLLMLIISIYLKIKFAKKQ